MKIRPGGAAVDVGWRGGSAAAEVGACAEAISEVKAGRPIAAFSAGNADRSLAPCGGSAPGSGGLGTGAGEPAKTTRVGAVDVETGAAAADSTIPVGGAARIALGLGPVAASWVWTGRGSLASRAD